MGKAERAEWWHDALQQWTVYDVSPNARRRQRRLCLGNGVLCECWMCALTTPRPSRTTSSTVFAAGPAPRTGLSLLRTRVVNAPMALSDFVDAARPLGEHMINLICQTLDAPLWHIAVKTFSSKLQQHCTTIDRDCDMHGAIRLDGRYRTGSVGIGELLRRTSAGVLELGRIGRIMLFIKGKNMGMLGNQNMSKSDWICDGISRGASQERRSHGCESQKRLNAPSTPRPPPHPARPQLLVVPAAEHAGGPLLPRPFPYPSIPLIPHPSHRAFLVRYQYLCLSSRNTRYYPSMSSTTTTTGTLSSVCTRRCPWTRPVSRSQPPCPRYAACLSNMSREYMLLPV